MGKKVCFCGPQPILLLGRSVTLLFVLSFFLTFCNFCLMHIWIKFISYILYMDPMPLMPDIKFSSSSFFFFLLFRIKVIEFVVHLIREYFCSSIFVTLSTWLQGDLVVYEMNVRAFTADESSCLDQDMQGTYAGLIEKVLIYCIMLNLILINCYLDNVLITRFNSACSLHFNIIKPWWCVEFNLNSLTDNRQLNIWHRYLSLTQTQVLV